MEKHHLLFKEACFKLRAVSCYVFSSLKLVTGAGFWECVVVHVACLDVVPQFISMLLLPSIGNRCNVLRDG